MEKKNKSLQTENTIDINTYDSKKEKIVKEQKDISLKVEGKEYVPQERKK